jgi:hypothetical protein
LVAQGNGCWGRAVSSVAADDSSCVDGTGRDGSRLGGVPGRWDNISGWRRRDNISGGWRNNNNSSAGVRWDYIGSWWWWRNDSGVLVRWDHVGSWWGRWRRNGGRLATNSGCLCLRLAVCARAVGNGQGSRLGDAVCLGANREGSWRRANSSEDVGSVSDPSSVFGSGSRAWRGRRRKSLGGDRTS